MITSESKGTAFRRPLFSAFDHKMTKTPFMLAQVVLKTYAVLLALTLLLPLRLILIDVIWVLIKTGFVIALLKASKDLSVGRIWARIVSYIVFVGSAGLSIPMFMQPTYGKDSSLYFWIPLWLITLSGLGLVSLLIPTLFKRQNIEHAAPGNREQAPGS